MTSRGVRATGTRSTTLVSLVSLVVIAALVGWGVHRQACYTQALRLAEAGRTDEAYGILSGLGGYRDSAQRAAELVADDPALPYRTAQKDDTVLLGTYEQDGDLSNGAEPIRWIVLDRIEDQLLLLAADCLDSRPYHRTPFEAVTWETSDLRAWLNGEFLRAAFTQDQRSIIVPTHNENDDQTVVGTEGGAATTDHVFALSQTQALIYMGGEEDRYSVGRAPASAYATRGRLYVDPDSGTADWWLRSPGTYAYAAQYVSVSGTPSVAGASADVEFAVRPALWLSVAEAERNRQ